MLIILLNGLHFLFKLRRFGKILVDLLKIVDFLESTGQIVLKSLILLLQRQ